MATSNVFLVLAAITCSLPAAFGVSPLLSLPGNASIVVFLDVHTGKNCTQADWSVYELGQSLIWRHRQGNSSNGLEIYDTCRSSSRVLEILRMTTVTAMEQGASKTVAGVISYTQPDIADLISDSLLLSDTLHVALGGHARDSRAPGQSSTDFKVDFLSKNRILAVMELLQELQWSYVTTVTDGGQLSQLEHNAFLSMHSDKNICVQYSQGPNTDPNINLADVKTPGVVIFASEAEHLEQVSRQLPASKSAIVVTNNAEMQYIQNGVVISDKYSAWDDFAEFMAQTLWKQYTDNVVLKEFYQNQFNCSHNISKNELMCENKTNIQKHILDVSTSLQMNMLSSVYDLVTMVTEEMTKTLCTDQRWEECISMDDVIKTSTFSKTDDGVLSLASMSLELRKIESGKVAETGLFTIPDIPTFSTNLKAWLSTTSNPFPSSQCDNWCPICQSKSCDPARQVKYTESHYVIPGDIMLLGLFPLSSEWNENGAGHCSGVPVEMNTDVLVESFLYAVKTVKTRYQDVLPNVTVGAMVLDTCSSPRKALQLYMNFESCLYEFERHGNNWRPSPYITPASLTLIDSEQKPMVAENLGQNKARLIVEETGTISKGNELSYDTSMYSFDTVVKILNEMKWTYMGVIRSDSLEKFDIDLLYTKARTMNVCVHYDIAISSDRDDMDNIINEVIDSSANTVVMFATSRDVSKLFGALTKRTVVKNWIIIETRKDILDIPSYPVPLGTIFVKKSDNQNTAFNSHIASVYTQTSGYDQNPWKQKFDQRRLQCTNCKYPDLLSNPEVFTQASDIIKSVDIMFAAIDGSYKKLCSNSKGLCESFLNNGANEVIEELESVELTYLNENINLSRTQLMENFVIYNLQKTGEVEVGRWTDDQLTLDSNKVVSYNSRSEALGRPRDSVCSSMCQCLNSNNVTNDDRDITMFDDLDTEMGYMDSTAKFHKELWSIIVIIIAGTGSLLTLFLMMFIMCKVCSGALVRRYLVLGLMLLIAMVFLFMSVLPFVFTPSESVCGMRFFAHGFSYAFSFAIILTKMTTLRDYKYIGLGGEISRINQLLSVLFITGVQIAIGVQWWVTRGDLVYSKKAFEKENDDIVQKTYYACDFDRGDFLAYHSYVIFLIVLCCVYAIGVRKETKNMKEARLLLICSWFCLAIWIALIVTLLVLDREFLEAVCAIGLLATALSMMVVIYMPKLTAISRLKYEVEQASRKDNNGYKIDPDFQFERPHSLPGTMHSSITDKTLSYPRSLAAFDTSLSY